MTSSDDRRLLGSGDGRRPTGFTDDVRAALAVVVAAVIAVAIRTSRRVRRSDPADGSPP